MSRLDTVHVVVPARDEEQLIGSCLDSLARARDALRGARPDLEVRITVVLDRCADGTADIVRAAGGVEALEVVVTSVGAARAAGVHRASCDSVGGAWTDRTWVACTDADSRVPVSWLMGQVRCAEAGYAARVGTVRPDLAHVEPALYRRWLSRHELGPGHTHVHGANLGFSLAAYHQVGGFPHDECGEDVELVRRLRLAGLPVQATASDPVMTSGRRVGRVRGGFADYLTGLATGLAEAT